MKALLNNLFNQYFSATEGNGSFRGWVYNGVENGTIILPAGMDEYDVYEAADNY
ncbi:hypothetical protein [Dysgonomonas sp. 521]|uniref:hypothetical protein n=1 Tax=Dysgonomonas sp. 521 TaxID=2302932 RepID=UPI0013CFD68F|nr:hypothetical protein [Dysgonomonas sp. 521]